MSITSIEIKFSKVGINRIDQPRKVNYIPVAVLQFDNLPKKKRIYLDGLLSDKKSVKQVLAGETFIALKIDDDFIVYDLEGSRQGQVSAKEYGELIQVNENSFILCKDRTVTWINDCGKVIQSRGLTDEEYENIHEK